MIFIPSLIETTVPFVISEVIGFMLGFSVNVVIRVENDISVTLVILGEVCSVLGFVPSEILVSKDGDVVYLVKYVAVFSVADTKEGAVVFSGFSFVSTVGRILVPIFDVSAIAVVVTGDSVALIIDDVPVKIKVEIGFPSVLGIPANGCVVVIV